MLGHRLHHGGEWDAGLFVVVERGERGEPRLPVVPSVRVLRELHRGNGVRRAILIEPVDPTAFIEVVQELEHFWLSVVRVPEREGRSAIVNQLSGTDG